MDTLMILCAKYLYLVVIAMGIIFLLFQKRKVQIQILIFVVISLPLTYLLGKIAGHFYFDPRPFVALHIKPLIPHAATNGFPSDHTLISAAISAVLYFFNKKWGIAAGILAVLVGISRVYVRIHSPIDIIGAIVIAIIGAVIVKLLLAKILPKHENSAL